MERAVRSLSAAVVAAVAAAAIVSGTLRSSAAGRDPGGIDLMAQDLSTGVSTAGTTPVYGPRGAPTCTGVPIGLAQEPQSVVERYPAGTAFCFLQASIE